MSVEPRWSCDSEMSYSPPAPQEPLNILKKNNFKHLQHLLRPSRHVSCAGFNMELARELRPSGQYMLAPRARPLTVAEEGRVHDPHPSSEFLDEGEACGWAMFFSERN